MLQESCLGRFLMLLAAKISQSEGKVGGDIEEGCSRVEGEVERRYLRDSELGVTMSCQHLSAQVGIG